MKLDYKNSVGPDSVEKDTKRGGKGEGALETKVGEAVDALVEYLLDNDMKGIHPLITGEVEKRLIVKTLELSRGNKVQAARILGLGRNTFSRKVRKLQEAGFILDKNGAE
jgi:DNA-binding protein Fis